MVRSRKCLAWIALITLRLWMAQFSRGGFANRAAALRFCLVTAVATVVKNMTTCRQATKYGLYAGPQLLRGAEPVFFGGLFRTALGLPDFMCAGGNLFMTERSDAMDIRRVLVSVFGVLKSLPGMLRAGQVFLLLFMLFRCAMGVRGNVVEFRRPLMILIVRSVVIACRHSQRLTICPDLAWASLASS
jgi:hypothetical protein